MMVSSFAMNTYTRRRTPSVGLIIIVHASSYLTHTLLAMHSSY